MTFTIIGTVFEGCQTTSQPKEPCSSELMKTTYENYSIEDCAQKERDEIYSLLAYTLVLKDWQGSEIPRLERRGYNIGSVLVNPEGKPVHQALNCVNEEDNSTQHGELRLIDHYIDSVRSFHLRDYTVYTTLEPCAMCAGMMIMTNVQRTVFGQYDVEYSSALERLSFDSRSIGGYPPYPRQVISDAAPVVYRQKLDSAFQVFLNTDEERYLAKFLSSEEAKSIFKEASQAFFDFEVEFVENEKVLQMAHEFYKQTHNK